jgi:hypothetical protein
VGSRLGGARRCPFGVTDGLRVLFLLLPPDSDRLPPSIDALAILPSLTRLVCCQSNEAIKGSVLEPEARFPCAHRRSSRSPKSFPTDLLLVKTESLNSPKQWIAIDALAILPFTLSLVASQMKLSKDRFWNQMPAFPATSGDPLGHPSHFRQISSL